MSAQTGASALKSSPASAAGLGRVSQGQSEHFLGHVQAVDLAGGANPPSGEQNIDTTAATEIEHTLAFTEARRLRWDCRSPVRRPPLLNRRGGGTLFEPP